MAKRFFAAVFVDLIFPLASDNLVILPFICRAANVKTAINAEMAKIVSKRSFGSISSISLNAPASINKERLSATTVFVTALTAILAPSLIFGSALNV